MPHNPAAGAIVIMLRSPKMHGMAQAVSELTEQGSPAFEAALPILSQLLKAEIADREVRSIAYQLKAARFPNYRDLAGFDFASSEVNEALVRQLESGGLGLEEAMARFEEGVQLSQALQRQLAEVQRRVEVLKQGLGGEYRAEAMNALDAPDSGDAGDSL